MRHPAFLLALAALFTGTSAQALNLNPDGEGQVLIFPYYTVEGGQATLLSIHNRTRFGKALRVRLHEAQNGRDLREFNLYLAPRDVWTAAIYGLDDSGSAVLSTDDDSCTVPAIRHNTHLPKTASGRRYLSMSNFAYTGSNDDAGSNAMARSRSGHIEVIEMGVVTNGVGVDARGTLDAIRAGADGLPRNCGQLITAWSPFGGDAYWLQEPVGATDMLAPTPANGGGHLAGTAAIVDVTRGTQISYVADAIEGFSATLLHHAPNPGSSPQLSDANWPSADVASAYWVEQGVLRSARYPRERAIDAVSALFTHDRLHNEFAADFLLASEWVLTFPTKRFYVDPARTMTAIAPFSQRFGARANGDAGSAVGWHGRQHDRDTYAPEDRTCYETPMNPDCTHLGPLNPYAPEPRLFDETNVLAIGQGDAVAESRILSAPRAASYRVADYVYFGPLQLQLWSSDSPYVDGILDRALSRPDLDGHRLAGLPVTGFWVAQTTMTSVLANFAGLWRHRGTRCRVPSGAEPQSACPGTIRVPGD